MEKVKNFLESDKVNVRKKIKGKRAKSKLKRALIPIEDIILFGNNLKMMVADKINEGIYDRLSVDNTSGRFHSPLTQLKKGLRPFVKYNGETLYGIDIVNSQPLFALIILDFNLFMDNKIYEIIAHYNKTHHEMMKLDKQTSFTNPFSTMLFNLIKTAHTKRDVLNFKRNVAGGYFYENFSAELSLKGLLPIEISNDQIAIRKFAKEAVFTAFFSRTKDCVWNNHIKAFSKCYPTVYKIFTFIKHGANNHPALACLLQRFESKLVLHETCVEINKKFPHIPIFTVHDSIVTTSKYRAIVEQIFKEHLAKCLGINPPLKIEAW